MKIRRLAREEMFKVNGTSFHGQVVKTTREKLANAFGKPESYSSWHKTTYEWDCVVDGLDGEEIPFTIYDWKEYRPIGSDEVIEWHIGAKTDADAVYAFLAVVGALQNANKVDEEDLDEPLYRYSEIVGGDKVYGSSNNLEELIKDSLYDYEVGDTDGERVEIYDNIENKVVWTI
jgi:hypothetical protein